jgi:hypothetical protein
MRGGPWATMLSVRAMPSVHAARSGVYEDPNFCLSAGVSVVGWSHMRRGPPTAGVLRAVLRVFLILQYMVLRV